MGDIRIFATPFSDRQPGAQEGLSRASLETERPFLGFGVASLTGERSAARAVITKEPRTETIARKDMWEIERIETLNKLRTVLNVSAGASFTKSIKGHASFYRETDFDERSVYLSIRTSTIVRVSSFPSYPINPELLTDLQNLTVDANEIYRKYGDRFVMEVGYGGEYVCIVKFYARTETEKTNIAAGLKGAFGKWSVKADATQQVDKMHQYTHEIAYHDLQGALGGKPELDKALEYVAAFPDKVWKDKVPWPVWLSTAPLNQLEGFPVEHSEISVRGAENALEKLEARDDHLRTLFARWDDVSRNPHHFIDENLAVAAKTKSAIDRKRTVIGELAEGIFSHPAGDITVADVPIPTSFERLPEEVPTLLPTFIASGTFVKREPRRGNGVGSFSVNVAVQDPTDLTKNWFPWHAGTKQNIRKLRITLNQSIPYVEIRYRGLYPQGLTAWKVIGETSDELAAPDGISLLLGVEFALNGPMADAYWLEYQVHAMKFGNGDSDIWGNTDRMQHRDGPAQKNNFIEAVRLAIWPK